MKKGYKQKTPLLGLPVLGLQDRILPEVELAKWRAVENLLIAGTQGVKACVFDEGTFRLMPTSDSTYDVSLAATGVSTAVEGMIGGSYFRVSSSIFWREMEKGNNYWLYLRATTNTVIEPSSVRPVFSRYRLEDSPNSLLIAEINMREMGPEINPYPDGKIYSKDIARHASDKENPHGIRLYQNELVVNKLIFNTTMEESPVIQIEVDGEKKEFSADQLPGAISQLSGRAVAVIDFDSFGPEGGVLQAPGHKKVLHAQVQRRAVGKVDLLSGGVGEIAVGYHGEDERNDEPNEFTVYNSGQVGLPMRAIIFCG